MAWSELQPLILQFYKQIYTDFFKNRDRFKFCVNKKNDIKTTILYYNTVFKHVKQDCFGQPCRCL